MPPPIPPPPPPPIGGAGFSSFFSATRHSVVSTIPAMLAAFCSAERVTFAGSTIPAFTVLKAERSKLNAEMRSPPSLRPPHIRPIRLQRVHVLLPKEPPRV